MIDCNRLSFILNVDAHRVYYKSSQTFCDDNPDFLNTLNTYFSRFEEKNNTVKMKLPLSPDDAVLCLDPADVWRALCGVDPRKAVGPDNISGYVLRECVDQLMDVLTDIYNTSLSQTILPSCFYQTTAKVTCINTQWLLPDSPHSHCDEALWKTGQKSHHIKTACSIRPISVCIST